MSTINNRGPFKQRPKTALWVALSPLLGLVYVILLPLIGLFTLAFLAVRAMTYWFGPSRAAVVYPDGGLPIKKAKKQGGKE